MRRRSASPLFLLSLITYSGTLAQPASADTQEEQAFQRKVVTAIRQHWDPPTALQTAEPVVLFKIRNDGKVDDIRIKQSSGNATADKLAIAAVRAAGSFVPFPTTINAPYIEFQYKFQNIKTAMSYLNGQAIDAPRQLGDITYMPHQDTKSKFDDQLRQKHAELLERIDKLKAKEASGDPTTFLELARAYAAMQDFKPAFEYYAKATEGFEKSNSTKELVQALTEQAKAYGSIGNKPEALKCSERAYELCKSLDDTAIRKSVIETRASLLYKSGNTTEADKLYAELRSLGR